MVSYLWGIIGGVSSLRASGGGNRGDRVSHWLRIALLKPSHRGGTHFSGCNAPEVDMQACVQAQLADKFALCSAIAALRFLWR